MRNGTPEQAARVREAIEHGGLDELAPVLDAVRQTGALDYARRQAQVEVRIACDAIAHLPCSTYLDSLLELAAFAVERNY
jgi:octaprenyl-diphosphate synthase